MFVFTWLVQELAEFCRDETCLFWLCQSRSADWSCFLHEIPGYPLFVGVCFLWIGEFLWVVFLFENCWKWCGSVVFVYVLCWGCCSFIQTLSLKCCCLRTVVVILFLLILLFFGLSCSSVGKCWFAFSFWLCFLSFHVTRLRAVEDLLDMHWWCSLASFLVAQSVCSNFGGVLRFHFLETRHKNTTS